MDLQSLAVVLRAALSHVPEERKAAEASLTQVRSRSRAPARCSPLLDHALAPGTAPPPLSLPLSFASVLARYLWGATGYSRAELELERGRWGRDCFVSLFDSPIINRFDISCTTA